MSIRHQSHADAAPAGWPNRWAGEGRALAQIILDRLAPGGLPPVVDGETRTWLPELLPLSDWGSALTLPPTTERLRWEFAFQEHLVRGWVGLVPGLTTINRSGLEEATLDQLLQRMKSGDWQEASAPGVRLFSRTLPERTEWFSIAPATDATGWSVVWWQERSGMPDLFETWGDAAAKGDRGAAGLLHAYRDCPALPKQLQDAARQVPAAAGK